MPHFQIKLLEGITEEQKQKLAEEVVRTAMDIIGYGVDAYSVTIQDVTKEQWKDEVYPKDINENKDILYKKPGYSV